MPHLNSYLLVAFALSAFTTASPLRNYVRDAPVPSNVAPGTVTAGCTAFHTVSSGETCTSIEIDFGLANAAFHSLNPELNFDCTNLVAGLAYCVQSTSFPSSPPPPATTPPNVANGTVIDGCDEFFTVSAGGSCSAIEAQFGISDALFHTLNPELNSLCTNLIAGDAYCVAGNPTTVTVPPNVASGTITAGCTQFVTVQSGDSCSSIEGDFGITNAQFSALNPEINAQCTNLIAGEAYCVGGSA